jgi:hypothetical protein
MKKYFVAAVLSVVMVTSAFAADDGNAKWRLSQANVYTTSTEYDIIATTNGAGNVKGVQCSTDQYLSLKIYVNGGAAETFTFDPGLSDDGFIPFNIRFSSSIRVSGTRSGGSNYTDHVCSVSWGLD